MMQLSRFHKDRGDKVERYNPLFQSSYDRIYAFSIFTFSDKGYITPGMICGGTGFDIQSRLPIDIEGCDYDYSISPACQTSYIWFSRGCIRSCPFCIVREKEGLIHPVKPKNLNPRSKYITVQDNNFFANPEWRSAIGFLRKLSQPVDFQQGFDARIMTSEMCQELNKFQHYKQIRFAWDNPKDKIADKLKSISEVIKSWKIMCYVLIGYWSTEDEDLYRVRKVAELGMDPFVMPYNKDDPYQKAFARWVNNKAVFYSTSWQDYKRRPESSAPCCP